MYRSKGKGWLRYSGFILTDAICLAAALVISYYIRHDSFLLFSDEFYLALLVLYPVFHLALALFFGAYRKVITRGYWVEFKATLAHNALIFLMVIMFLFVSKQSETYSRIVICLTAVLSSVFMYLSRICLKKLVLLVRRLIKKSAVRILILSDSGRIEKTVRTATENNLHTYNICGLIVTDKDMTGRQIGGVPVVASVDTWKDYVVSNVVDEVLVDLEDTVSAAQCVEYINLIGATAHMVLPIDAVIAPSKTVQELNGFTVISCSLNSASPRQRFLKRLIDIVFGLVGAVAVVILTVVIGPLIFLEDRGPIFFTQKRVGRNGRVFRIIKFRTMYTDAEQRKASLEKENEMSGQIFKMKNDPRVTRIGRFLRRTSIDELPQAFNILAGTMSVVGTRPPTLDEFMRYEPHHKVRLGIVPGLTGLWQVSGRSKITDFDEIVKLDEQYISKWNLGLDLRIILKTIVVVLRREGAE